MLVLAAWSSLSSWSASPRPASGRAVPRSRRSGRWTGHSLRLNDVARRGTTELMTVLRRVIIGVTAAPFVMAIAMTLVDSYDVAARSARSPSPPASRPRWQSATAR